MINLERLSNLSKEQRIIIKILYRIEKVRDKGGSRDIDMGEELWFGLYRIIEFYGYKVSKELYESYLVVNNNPIYKKEVLDIVSIMNEEVYDKLIGGMEDETIRNNRTI